MTSRADSPAPSHAGPSSLVGAVLSDRYRIETLIGEGGMGAVYLAEHMLMHKRVAVKVLHPEMTRMPEMVARFEREAMAAAHIEHPNVAAATDFGKLSDGAFFLVLEYVEGQSLRDLMADGPLAVELVLHIAAQIASALLRAHGLGIVHRDLKPDNVMLVDRHGEKHFVKVLDFGVAKVPVGEFSRQPGAGPTKAPLTQLGMVYGTPEYMAPEQALGQEVDRRADLYALGVIVFEMLTGLRPFDAESKVVLLGMKVTSDPPSMRSMNPEVHIDAAVEALVRRLLAKEASQRFQDASELLESIEHCRTARARVEPSSKAVRSPAPSTSDSAEEATLLALPREPAPTLQPELTSDARSGAGRMRWSGAARVGAWVSAVRHKLPAALREVPPLLLIGAVGIVLLIAFLVGIASMRDKRPAPVVGPLASETASAPAPVNAEPPPSPPLLEKLFAPAPTAPTAEELAAAAKAGSAALQELAARFPGDVAVWRALVRAHLRERHVPEAMRAVGKLSALSEAAAEEESIRTAVRSAAQGSPESADAAFALMQTGLGSRGPDWLYDLVTARGIPQRTSARAKQALAKGEVRSRMSGALAVAWDLRNATGCEAKKALLPRATQRGDGRALPLLRPLSNARGCGFLALGDCFSCLHRDGALAAAIAAIEERTDRN